MNQSTSTDTRIYKLIATFKIDADIASVAPFGSGHINDTYRIRNSDPNGVDYLLQRVNHHVFKDVPVLMQNLLYVTEHLKLKLAEIPGTDLEKEVMTIVETHDGKPYFQDSDGNYWRVFHFLKDTRSYDQVTTGQQAYEGGKAFGRFQALLADMEPGLIKDTIPDFHNVESRLGKFEQAVKADKVGRLHNVLPEVEFIRQRIDEMSEILRLGRAGKLPLRIVHNDTKFNNVLLNTDDQAQCVIDLDTVMPGYVAYDFGDSIRNLGANDGLFFPLPEPLITGPATRVMSLRDGTKKMSKSDSSDNSRINLTDDADTIAQKIRKAKTDPEPLPSEEKGLEARPEADNLVGIYAALAGRSKAEVLTEFGGGQFSSFKNALVELCVAKLSPIASEMKRLVADPGHVDSILIDGAQRAQAIAVETMNATKDIVGFIRKT